MQPKVGYTNYENRFPKYESSRGFNVGKNQFQNFGVTALNGICTVFDTCYNWTSGISEMFGGAQIRGIYNATHGFFWDLYESALGLYFNIATEPVKKTIGQWRDILENKGPDALLLHICHSQGAIHTKVALHLCPKEIRERIVIIAIGPAAYIPKHLCKQVTHLVSKNDPVTRIDWRGRIRERNTIKFLEPSPGVLFDHFLENQAYKEALREEVNIFKKQYGDYIW